MASRAFWAPHEVAVLEELAGADDWLERAAALLKDRSLTSIQSRMKKLQADRALIDGRSMGYYNANAINGSKALLAAYRAAGYA